MIIGKFYNGGSHPPKFGDLAWINEQIGQLPIRSQRKFKDKYMVIYEELEGQNEQRFRVNTWLRKVVAKHKTINIDNDLPF